MSLDRMDRMRAAHKAAEKRENIRHPVSGEEMDLGEYGDRSLRDIFQDKKTQDRFLNRYLFNVDPDKAKDIIDAFAENRQLDPDQMAFLEKTRAGFNLRSAEVDTVSELFTEDKLSRIADTDPRIREVIGQIGLEDATGLLSAQFEDLAFSDEKAFKKLLKHMNAEHGIRTSDEARKLDAEVGSTLREFGISEKDYFDATRSGLSVETHENLDELVAKQFGLFKKGIDWISKGKLSYHGGEELFKQLGREKQLMKECDKHLKAIGGVLHSTLNPDLRLAMQKYMLEGGSIEEKKQKDNVQTIGDYKKIKDDLASTQTRWKEFEKTETERLRMSSVSERSAYDKIKDTFAEQEFQKQKQYRARGVLAALLAFLFGSRTKDDIKNSLK